MGVTYYECETCKYCHPEDYMSEINVRNYTMIRICNECCAKHMQPYVPDFVVIDKRKDYVLYFTSFDKLAKFLEENFDENNLLTFGLKNTNLYCANTKTELIQNLTQLKTTCQLKTCTRRLWNGWK